MSFIEQAEQVIANSTKDKLLLVDYEREPILYVDKNTLLFVKSEWQDSYFYGWNVIALDENYQEIIIEHYDDTDEITGKELGVNAIENIKNAIAAGATYLVIPSN